MGNSLSPGLSKGTRPVWVPCGCPWPGSEMGCECWACLGWAGRPVSGSSCVHGDGLFGACGWLAGRAEPFVCGCWEQQPKVLFGFVQDPGVHFRPVTCLWLASQASQEGLLCTPLYLDRPSHVCINIL